MENKIKELINLIDRAIKDCKLSLKENKFIDSHQEGYCKGFLDAMNQVKEWMKFIPLTGENKNDKFN